LGNGKIIAMMDTKYSLHHSEIDRDTDRDRDRHWDMDKDRDTDRDTGWNRNGHGFGDVLLKDPYSHRWASLTRNLTS
jgi:hypothetical protein